MLKHIHFKRSIFFSILLALFSLPSLAEVNTYTSTIHWKEGEKNNYKLSKSRQKIEAGQVILQSTNHTMIGIKVLKATHDGYLISWTFGETKFDNPDQANNPIVKKMSNLLTGFRMIVNIDKQGAIIDVVNWQDLQNKAMVAVDEIISFIRKSSVLPEQQIQQLEQQTKSVYSSKEQIILLTSKEIGMFLFALGKDYSSAQPVKYNDYLPNPFGGAPFPSEASLSLDSINNKTDIATIKWAQELDPYETKRIMFETMKNMAWQMGRPEPSLFEVPDIQVNDKGLFKISMSSGWVNEITHSRTTLSAGVEQEDTLHIVKQ